jgi:hypothetical protein
MDTKQFETEDSILTGTLTSLGCKFTSFYNKDRARVMYRTEEDVRPYLERLEANERVGSLTLLQNCKSARAAIFTLKTVGNLK